MNAFTPWRPLVLCMMAVLFAAGCNQAASPEPGMPDAAATPPTTDTAGAAAAVAAPADLPPQYVRMDRDTDGAVSADEHAATASSMFTGMDSNGDGMVVAEEMEASGTRLGGDPRMDAATRIRAADANGDSGLSREEYTRGARTLFDQMDADGDGRLTGVETQVGRGGATG